MNTAFKTHRFPSTLVLSFFVFLISLATLASAQSHFTPLKPEDVKESESVLKFIPGIAVSGDYDFHAIDTNSGTFTDEESEENQGLQFQHDLRLDFRSVVHRNASLNLEIATQASGFNNADLRDPNSTQAGSSVDSQAIGLFARQAYLEYNSNPNNILRFGKQELNIGDRRGKVFSGVLSGIAQTCTMGTWCYDLGALKMGEHPADWLYVGALKYPVIESGNLEEGTNHNLDVEVFRIFYTERDIPLGKSNISTQRNLEDWDAVGTTFTSGSDAQKAAERQSIRQAVDRQGRPLYYDAIQQEYFGLRLDWEISGFLLNFDLTGNQGQRRYHLNTGRNSKPKPDLGSANDQFKSQNRVKQNIAGVASELEMRYRMENHQFLFRWMTATGDREREDKANEGNNFLRPLNGYTEIIPGSYQGTRLYFNGPSTDISSGTGLGHSVNNTTLYGGLYRYETIDFPANLEIGLFSLGRNQSVLNEKGDRVQDIGIEWDNRFVWNFEKHLSVQAEANFFQPKDAYSYNDNSVPLEENELITQFVGRVLYSF